MANLLQYYFFPTDFYYPRTSNKTQITNEDQRQVILPAKNPNTARNSVNEHGDHEMKDAADKNSSRVKATSFGMSFVPDNKQILGLHCRSDRPSFRVLMNAKLSRQVPDKYRDNQISNSLWISLITTCFFNVFLLVLRWTKSNFDVRTDICIWSTLHVNLFNLKWRLI